MKVFTFLTEERLRSEFLKWANENGRGEFSYPTLSRALDREQTKKELTPRQEKARRVALEFIAERQE